MTNITSVSVNPDTKERITERINRRVTGAYSILQTSEISDMRAYSGNYATKEEAERALTDADRAMLGGLVNIVYRETQITETIITTETIV